MVSQVRLATLTISNPTDLTSTSHIQRSTRSRLEKMPRS